MLILNILYLDTLLNLAVKLLDSKELGTQARHQENGGTKLHEFRELHCRTPLNFYKKKYKKFK